MFKFWAKSSFKSHPHRIIIDITTSCNLHCIDCNRSCGQNQAPDNEHMSPDQIRKFVNESLEQGRLWYGRAEPTTPSQNGMKIEGGDPAIEGLRIEGGEPTMHPRLFEILGILLDYKRKHAPLTNIVLCTNGYSEHTRLVLIKMPSEITIVDSAKQSIYNSSHCAFNSAPKDDRAFKRHDFSKGCWLPLYYGIGLTRHGYYPHPICGSIDRVLGFNMGLKELPSSDYSWAEFYKRLCPYCGHYYKYAPSGPIGSKGRVEDRGKMSPSWQTAYSEYRKKKPVLSVF